MWGLQNYLLTIFHWDSWEKLAISRFFLRPFQFQYLQNLIHSLTDQIIFSQLVDKTDINDKDLGLSIFSILHEWTVLLIYFSGESSMAEALDPYPWFKERSLQFTLHYSRVDPVISKGFGAESFSFFL